MKKSASVSFGGFQCGECGRTVEGDTHTFVRHIIACRTGAIADTDATNASVAAPAVVASGKRQGQRVVVFGGASAERRDYVEEELSVVRAMYADTITVLHEEDSSRFPAATIDCTATITRTARRERDASSEAVDEAAGGGPTEAEARVFLTVEYTAGYPFAPPNIDVVEATKDTIRRSAWDHIKREVQAAVKAGLASQDPFLPAIIQAVQSALEDLSIASSGGDPGTSGSGNQQGGDGAPHVEFVFEPATNVSPVPTSTNGDAVDGPMALSPLHAPADFATQQHQQQQHGRRHGTPAHTGSPQVASAVATPIHTAAKAPPLAVAPMLSVVATNEQNSELERRRRACELVCMHLLRRLCTGTALGAGSLPPNAYDTLRVYLEDQGVVYDARADASHRMLRRVFKTAIDSARDPVLAWLWAPADGDAGRDADGDNGRAKPQSQLAQSRRFQREFVETAQLGAGGFGSVHACIRYVDRRKYAVKKVVMRRAKSGVVLREVRTLAALEHPNIVRYYDCWLEAGKHGDVVESSDEEEEEEEDDGLTDSDDGVASSTSSSDGGARMTPTTAPPRNSSGHAAAAGGTIETKARPTAHDFFGDFTDDDEDDEEAEVEEEEDDGASSVVASVSADDETDTEEELADGEATESGRAVAKATPGATSSAADTAPDGDDALMLPGRGGAAGKDYCTLYVQMELCQPFNLQDVIDDGRLRRREDVLYHVLRQLLNVLTFVHSRGAVHRDLKPANVLFDGASADLLGDIKVADFGLARYLGEAGAEAAPETTDPAEASPGRRPSQDLDARLTSGCGTMLYAAPEQMSVLGGDVADAASPYGAKVDEFSVGVIWFEMWLAAASPLDYRERREAIATLRRTQRVPAWLRKAQPLAADVIEMLVRHDPKTRASAAEVLALDRLPGDPSEIAAALEAIGEHRDRIGERVVQRLIATSRPGKAAAPAPAALPDDATQHAIHVFDRVCGQRNARAIDAHHEQLPLGHAPVEALDAAKCDVVLDRRGEPVVLLKDPSLAVGAWHARRSRALGELGAAAVFRGACVHGSGASDADAGGEGSVTATFSVHGPGVTPGQRIAEAAAFAASLLGTRELRPRRGGYAMRLYHPAVAATAAAVGIPPIAPEQDFTAAPVASNPTAMELLQYPVRILQESDWTDVHRAATALLERQPPAARAALDELDHAVAALLAARAPSDLPIEVFPFGAPPSARAHQPHLHRHHHAHHHGDPDAPHGSPAPEGAFAAGLHGVLIRYHDDGQAAGVARRHVDPNSSAAASPRPLSSSTGGKKKSGQGTALLHSTAPRVFDVAGRLVCDPLVTTLAAAAMPASPTSGTAAPSFAAALGGSAAAGGRLTVLAVNLSAVARAAREPPLRRGCTVALCRGDGARNTHAGNIVAPADAERVLRAAKECWCAGAIAEPLYRSERSEEAAAHASASRHGLTHLLALHAPDRHLPDAERYRVLRHGMTAKEILRVDLHATRISEAIADLLGGVGDGDFGGVGPMAVSDGAAAAGATSGVDGGGPVRRAEDVAQFSTFDVVGTTLSSAQHADMKNRAMTCFAHYHRYCVPRRVVAVAPDAKAEAVRLTLAEFASAGPDGHKKASAQAYKPLYDWLVHHSANLTTAAVYVADTDTIDVAVNHRVLCPSGGWATTRGKKPKDGKGKSKGGR